MEKARELARFASRLTFEDLPEDVVQKTKQLILDQLGCQIAGSTMPWCRTIFQFVKENGGRKRESTVVGYGNKVSVLDAAFANANFGHAFLGDDTDSVCHAHLGSIVIPAMFAIGERERVSGKELIGSIVAGYEIASRIGAAAGVLERRGYHPGPAIGPFGVAVGAGMILQLDERQLTNALAVAGSHCSGLMEYSVSGGSVNRLHSGIAAYGGIRSALLAQKGFTGPPTVLEGAKGFLNAFSGDYILEELTSGLGERFRVLLVGLKSNCACGTLEAALDCVSRLLHDHDIPLDGIEEIVVSSNSVTYGMTGQTVHPEDVTSAQFSGRFSIALRIMKGNNTFREYTEANLKEKQISVLESKIKYVLDKSLDDIPRSENAMRIAIKIRDGVAYEETTVAGKGSILNPMSKAEVEEKFRNFSSVLLSPERREEVIATVWRLDSVENVRDLSRLLAPL